MVQAADQPWVWRLVERIRKEMRDGRELGYRAGPYVDYDCYKCGVAGKFTFRRNTHRGEREEEFICGPCWEGVFRSGAVHEDSRYKPDSRLETARARHRSLTPPGLVKAAPPKSGVEEDEEAAKQEASSFDQPGSGGSG